MAKNKLIKTELMPCDDLECVACGYQVDSCDKCRKQFDETSVVYCGEDKNGNDVHLCPKCAEK